LKKGKIGAKIKTIAVVSLDFKKKSLKKFPKEIPNCFSNGFKRTRNLPLESFLGTCLPVVKTWYISGCRECYAGYLGIWRLKERVRIYQKKTAKKIL
jgi:hypothetical protein